MLQRNTSGSPLMLPTLDPPVEVPPGGELDFPVPLSGFSPVEPAPQPVPKSEPRAKTKAPAPSDAEEATK